MTATHPGPGSVSGSGDGSASGPTVLRMLLGQQLRRLREARNISRERAGWEIRSSGSKISRIELGRVRLKERDIADLLTLYGVTDTAERDAMLSLARQANVPGWWQRYGDVHPKWLEPYLGLEAAASLIRTYEVQFIPGLLQTEAYARAVIRLAHRGARPDEVDGRVSLRLARQRVLRRADPPPPHLWAVLDEAALRRPIGGWEVMRGQLAALRAAAALPNVTVQVVRFAAGGHAAAGGAFTLLRFPDPEVPDVVYMEQLTSGLYLEQRRDVDTYAEVLERLCLEAEPPGDTVDLLEEILAEYG